MPLRNPKIAPATPAALGLRVHSGWAALVVLAGSPRSPALIDRRRLEIADPGIPGSRQPYHAAEPLDLKLAAQFIRRCRARTRLLARRALRSALVDLQEKGHKALACGILLASGRPLPSLARTLASHALIHTAEGEFFRDALIHAGRSFRLSLTTVRERELYARAAAELDLSANDLPRRLQELGRSLGPPWRQDEKLAALIAWLALATPPRR